MSKAIVSVNFNELKFNLYEVLGLTCDASENKIKKSFKKLVLNLHPDKNKDSNEDIYNHVIIANQVLTNVILRKEYDIFLDEKNKKTLHNDLKNNFEANAKDIEKYFPGKEEATNLFKSKIEELNKKHGVTEASNDNIMNQYEKMKKVRTSQVNIVQEKISDNDDFNNKFDSRKEVGGFTNQIIQVSPNTSLGTYQAQDGLTTIADYSRLYVEDSISTGSYTSLDMAFNLQKIEGIKNKSIDEKMKEYKSQTNSFNSRKPSDFSSKNFTDWQG